LSENTLNTKPNYTAKYVANSTTTLLLHSDMITDAFLLKKQIINIS